MMQLLSTVRHSLGQLGMRWLQDPERAHVNQQPPQSHRLTLVSKSRLQQPLHNTVGCLVIA
jgi:hypothetical protein